MVQTVVVNTDGTVGGKSSATIASTTTMEQPLRSLIVFGEMNEKYTVSHGKIVICYVDGSDSDKGKAVVGTFSGTSISFGSPVTF